MLSLTVIRRISWKKAMAHAEGPAALILQWSGQEMKGAWNKLAAVAVETGEKSRQIYEV